MRAKRIRANFLASVSNKSVLALEQFVLVPIYLSYWGAEYYGMWLTLSAIPSMLTISNFGVGSAAAITIVRSSGKGDQVSANSVLLSSSIILVAIYSALVLSLIYFSPLLFSDNYALNSPHLILALLMASVGLVSLMEPLEGFWIAKEKAALSMLMRSFLIIVRFSTITVLLLYEHEAFMVAVGGFAASLVWLIAYISMSIHLINWKIPFSINASKFRSLITKGAGFQLSTVWQAILFPGSIWLASVLISPIAAATWGTLRTVSRTGNQLISMVNHTLTPEFQNIVAKERWGEAKSMHSAALIISVSLSIFVAIFVSTMGAKLYTWWTLDKFTTSYWVWVILSVGFIFNAIWMSSEMVHKAFNQPWRINIFGIISALGAALIMGLVAKITMSVDGFVFGSIFFDCIMAFLVLRRSLFLLNDTFNDSLKRGYITLRNMLV